MVIVGKTDNSIPGNILLINDKQYRARKVSPIINACNTCAFSYSAAGIGDEGRACELVRCLGINYKRHYSAIEVAANQALTVMTAPPEDFVE